MTELRDLIAEISADFTPHPKHPNYRVPARPTPLDPLCDYVGADPGFDPQAISRTLFMLQWDSGPGFSSFWQLHALRLPAGERVYWVDDTNGRRVIAVGPGGAGADGRFCRALFASNGKDFSAPILDSAPSSIWTTLRGEIVIDLFLDAMPLAHNAYKAVKGAWPSAVRKWLRTVLAKDGRELRGKGWISRKEAQQQFVAQLERLVSDFPTHPENAGIKRAPSITHLAPLARTLGKEIDPIIRPLSQRLFSFAWSFSPMSNWNLEIYALLLSNGSRAFWAHDDVWKDNKQHNLIGIASREVTDLDFLRLYFRSNGDEFGYVIFVAPPHGIWTSVEIEELSDLLLNAYRANPDVWRQLVEWREQDGADDREIVASHLRDVLG